jgi:hypothetical protein
MIKALTLGGICLVELLAVLFKEANAKAKKG